MLLAAISKLSIKGRSSSSTSPRPCETGSRDEEEVEEDEDKEEEKEQDNNRRRWIIIGGGGVHRIRVDSF